MKKILYLDGASGISGDMTVAALLDLGASREKLDAVLNSLHLDGFDYAVTRKQSYGISGLDFDVRLQYEEHHHDLDHHDHHDHDHEHHDHEHHDHEHHDHEHRNLADVCAVIDRGEMSELSRALAKKIFQIVAEAEAKAHDCPVAEVHFHEVGALDSIADIVSAAVLADDLGITDCIVTGLAEGTGSVRCQHGELPVPVPAVLNIAQKYGIILRSTQVKGEMVTPTGIAIAAALRTSDALPSQYKVEKVGIGLGKRDFGRANLLRAMLISEVADPEQIYVLETNIDDSTGGMLGLAMEKLMSAGARDVHFMPCFMKKNRPAYLLRVISDGAHLGAMERIIFEATTSIGLRKFAVERTCMEREIVELQLPFGAVKAKRCRYDGVTRCYPEYESVKALAEKTGMPFQAVFEAAKQTGEV